MIIESNATHIPLKDESVHCIVTSPPYFGLRRYEIPDSIWDEVESCDHQWSEIVVPAANGIIHDGGMSGETLSGSSATRKPQRSHFCARCGAWKGQLGGEPGISLYVSHLVQVFREIRRVLRSDGVLWLNLGDSYASGKGSCYNPGGGERSLGKHLKIAGVHYLERSNISDLRKEGLKPKDLCEIPSDIVRALRDDGWWLRSRIPWIKRNCMPESVDDRPTVAIEYVFLLTKSKDYFYDAEPVKITASEDTHARYARGRKKVADYPGGQTIAETLDHMVRVPANYKGSVPGRKDGPGQDRRSKKDRCRGKETERDAMGLKIGSRFGREPGWRDGLPGVHPKSAEPGSGVKQNSSFESAVKDIVGSRNRRNSDWFFESWQGLLSDSEGDPIACVVNPQPYKGAHYSTFPEKLIEPMIRAGCPIGGITLDPFHGSGTVGAVAERLNRRWVGLDLGYHDLQKRRLVGIQKEMPLMG